MEKKISKLEWLKEIKMIKQEESEVLELKESLSVKEEIGKPISAFSNTGRGRIIIGVNDSGKVIDLHIGKNTIETKATIYSQLGRLKTTPKTNEKIIELIKKNLTITKEKLAKQLDIIFDGIKYHIKNLRKKEVIEWVGPAKAGHWKIIKK